MAWKKPFEKGLSCFRAAQLEDSLLYFNKAIEIGGDQYILYDSRSAVYDRLGRPKDALRDAKQVVTLAPDRWQGYARSARVFVKAHRHDAALIMIDLALERVKPDDTNRRVELNNLKEEALRLRESARNDHIKRLPVCHFGLLPLEICAEIFKEVVSCDSTQVLCLSHICRQWRDMVLNTAALWGTLVLSKNHPAKKAKTWATRSKGRIMELCIRKGAMNDPDWPVTKLNSLSWTNLRTFTLEDHIFLGSHLPSISMLPNLEDLQISRCSIDWRCFLANFTEASVRSLKMDGVYFEWTTLVSHFTNLVSLVVRHLNPCQVELVLAVIEANPALEHLVLYTSLFPATTVPPLIHLPCLTSVECAGAKWTPDIFSSIVCPSLQKLVLSHALSVDAVFTGGWTTLTELRVKSCGVTASVLVRFLQSASSLETLELSYLSDVSNAVAEALANSYVYSESSSKNSPTIAGESLPLCPSLTYLDFSHCDDLKTGPLIRLVKSRLHSAIAETFPERTGEAEISKVPAVAQISTLVVDGCPRVDCDALPWLRSKVKTFSCTYMTKKSANWKR